jgi:Domain of unknown function (DUF4124)
MATSIRSILLVAALACVTSGVSAQTVYKEVDDTGYIMFSDQPPARPAVIPRRGYKVEVNEAARRLKQAQLERKLGAQPGPGELNIAPGARTANYRYWRRQEKLRLAVEQAQRRSRETLAPQLASR